MKTKTLLASTVIAVWLPFAASVRVATATCAAPTTWYVATTGSDTTTCGTQTSPCRSINYVQFNKMPLGDTVLVAPGTYDENDPAFGTIVTNNIAGTSSSCKITYKSQVKWGAVIIGADNSATQTDATNHPGWWNFQSYAIIDGFDFVGRPNNTTNGTYASEWGVVLAGAQNNPRTGDHSILQNSRVHGFALTSAMCIGDGGAGVGVRSDHSQVIGNVIYGNGFFPCSTVHGIYWKFAYGLAAENIIYGNGGIGLQEWGASSNVTVVNNTIFGNAYSGILVGNDGAGDDGGPTTNTGSFVDNNIVYNNASQGGTGIKEYCSSMHPNCVGVTGNCSLPVNVFDNNILYHNPRATGNISLVTGVQSGTIQSDPLFTSNQLDGTGIYIGRPSLNDQSGSVSPALDAGLMTDTNTCGQQPPFAFPNYDFAGNPRADNGGTNFDIGAWECSY